MTHVANIVMRLSIVAAAGFVGLFWSGDVSQNWQSAMVSSADARIGRPLTPMSYAGVARRTVRRGVVVAPVVVAPRAVVVAPRPVVVAPAVRCAQVVNVYGQIATVCR